MNKILLLLLLIPFFLMNCKEKDETPDASPSKMSITGVTINKFPSVDVDNNDWDGSLAGTHPDVYFVIYDGKDNVVYELPTANRKENLRNADLPYTFTRSTPFCTFSDLNQRFSVALFDFDSLDEDDFIGGLSDSKKLSEYGKNTPGYIDLVNGDYNFRVLVEWIY